MTWFQSLRGGLLDPYHVRPDQVDIEEIATVLANTCRYRGHVPRFYSVAEHCVHVADLTGHPWGLLHDAGEWAIGDIPTLVKHQEHFRPEVDAEDRILATIGEVFDLGPIPEVVKRMDRFMLEVEASHFWPNGGSLADHLGLDVKDRRFFRSLKRVHCWSPDEARFAFLNKFHALRLDNTQVGG